MVLRKRSGDEGGDDTSAALAGMSQRIVMALVMLEHRKRQIFLAVMRAVMHEQVPSIGD
jgi:hypothetical protein